MELNDGEMEGGGETRAEECLEAAVGRMAPRVQDVTAASIEAREIEAS